MFDGLRYEVEYVVESDERAMTAYRMIAIHNRYPIDIRGVMSVVVEDGLLVCRTDYWDSLTFLHQSGQTP